MLGKHQRVFLPSNEQFKLNDNNNPIGSQKLPKQESDSVFTRSTRLPKDGNTRPP